MYTLMVAVGVLTDEARQRTVPLGQRDPPDRRRRLQRRSAHEHGNHRDPANNLSRPPSRTSTERHVRMSLTVHTLELGRAAADSTFFVRHRVPGTLVSAPVHGYLILGGDAPIVVDTGFRNDDVMARVGLHPELRDENSMEAQLDRYGVSIDEVGMVIQTHLHVDHAGHIDKFPTTTPVVVNRAEMEFAASGLQGLGYAPEDLKHMIDRTHAPDAVRWLDLELTGPVSVAPGVRCEHAGGHTDGSLVVYVDTEHGPAAICGDILYDIEDQVITGLMQNGFLEPQVSNNFSGSLRGETAAIKKVLNNATFVLPGHDIGAKVENGQVIGRVEGLTVPGPVIALPSPGASREVSLNS
ncbi:glyoxylase-like metal-dependent hydrolase (beta-lactamase superfamily II) [Pseudonocardia eucalypti]|uniref:MBL fold metallo-hydrolase n=1 Tax=Pseudonocardia eucalypti TaxID=648755 RepID=UPI001622663D|nr:glyoxylase-like metal-dependent hydrolase (beta-lactamase superfamily II) [Pseudonocardia eucalypti]